MDITLVLIDAGLARPEATLRHLADDFEEALAVYERHGASAEFPARTFNVRRVMIPANANTYDAGPHDQGLQGRVYAIACTDDTSPVAAVHALEEFARELSHEDCNWSGGIAIAGGKLVATFAHTPRMGKLRRPQSEAIDQLILAVRSSCALGDLVDTRAPRGARRKQTATSSNDIIVARRPVPAFAYPALAQHFEQKGRP